MNKYKEQIEYVDVYLRKEFSFFGFKIPYKKKVRFNINIPDYQVFTLQDIIDGKEPPIISHGS